MSAKRVRYRDHDRLLRNAIEVYGGGSFAHGIIEWHGASLTPDVQERLLNAHYFTADPNMVGRSSSYTTDGGDLSMCSGGECDMDHNVVQHPYDFLDHLGY